MEPRTCIDSEPFALRVIDASMAPEFPPGCIVIVDPGEAPRDGSYVLARLQEGPALRQLHVRDSRAWLEALDPSVPRTELPVASEDDPRRFRECIQGVIVQRAGRRRRDHRHYA